MIIYSEILNKEFDSVDACLDAELEFKRAEKEKKEAEAAHQKALDEAYRKAIDACDEYLRLAGIELEHCEYECEDDGDEDNDDSWIDELLDKFFELHF